jgi:hypothetical protein
VRLLLLAGASAPNPFTGEFDRTELAVAARALGACLMLSLLTTLTLLPLDLKCERRWVARMRKPPERGDWESEPQPNSARSSARNFVPADERMKRLGQS